MVFTGSSASGLASISREKQERTTRKTGETNTRRRGIYHTLAKSNIVSLLSENLGSQKIVGRVLDVKKTLEWRYRKGKVDLHRGGILKEIFL